MDTQQRNLINDIVVEGTTSLFAAFGVSLQTAGAFDVAPSSQGIKIAVIGFAGKQMCGSLLLNASDELLRSSYPVHGTTPDVAAHDLRDWTGELSNQLLGRIKKKLLGYGVVIQLSTPITLSGSEVRIGPPMPEAECLPYRFASESGWVQVRFEVMTDPDLVLTVAPPKVTDEIATEGDFLMFE